MSRPLLELADVFRRFGAAYRRAYAAVLPAAHTRIMAAIEACRTARLGGHIDTCDRCGQTTISYNSCRNRHCPKCQAAARREWLLARQSELLPVPYFHVVFTIPAALADLALQNKRVLYDILFATTARTLLTIARDPRHLGAQVGFLAVLHTWGQNLLLHPHLHCIVPGGGLSLDGARWVASRPGFFLPVRVLSRLFRRLYLTALQKAYHAGELHLFGSLTALRSPAAFASLLAHLRATDWVVYAKAPFGGPDQVLRYLGRYTHRVALSNDRILAIDDRTVSFLWKDYRDGSRQKVMTVDALEFIRRFLLHALPSRFLRIRHFGFLANRHRTKNISLCRTLVSRLDTSTSATAREEPPSSSAPPTAGTAMFCSACGLGFMRLSALLPPVFASS